MMRHTIIAALTMILLTVSGPLPAAGASRYKACSLLRSAEVEVTLGGRVLRTDERDDSVKDETGQPVDWSICEYALTSAGVRVQGQTTLEGLEVQVGPIPRTRAERERAETRWKRVLEQIRGAGGPVESRRFGSIECTTAISPRATSPTPFPPFGFTVCQAEKRRLYVVLSAYKEDEPFSIVSFSGLTDLALRRLP